MDHEVTSHRVNDANNQLKIVATDEPGPGGAYHRYLIEGYDGRRNPSGTAMVRDGTLLVFQNGGIKEVGVNGITHEALIAVLLDRLTAFQAGPFACEENAEAMKHLILAREALHNRTRKRTERGVEGKVVP